MSQAGVRSCNNPQKAACKLSAPQQTQCFSFTQQAQWRRRESVPSDKTCCETPLLKEGDLSTHQQPMYHSTSMGDCAAGGHTSTCAARSMRRSRQRHRVARLLRVVLWEAHRALQLLKARQRVRVRDAPMLRTRPYEISSAAYRDDAESVSWQIRVEAPLLQLAYLRGCAHTWTAQQKADSMRHDTVKVQQTNITLDLFNSNPNPCFWASGARLEEVQRALHGAHGHAEQRERVRHDAEAQLLQRRGRQQRRLAPALQHVCHLPRSDNRFSSSTERRTPAPNV